MMSPVCMFSVAIIHLFRLPPATSAMSADLCRRHSSLQPTVCSYLSVYILINGLHGWKLVSPARVVSHFNNLLFKWLGLSVWLVMQSLEVDHPVFLFVAPANAVCPYLPWVGERKTSSSFHSASGTSNSTVMKAKCITKSCISSYFLSLFSCPIK